MSHIMFGGLTHRPAVDLAERLVAMTPRGLDKVFLCDSGSVSVEVAIKMVLQYWYHAGRPERNKLVTVRGGYHGDTFGAMALCDPVNGMHAMFQGVLSQHHFAPAPCSSCGCAQYDKDGHRRALGLVGPECHMVEGVSDVLDKHGSEVGALVLEPLVQGAGGMRMYSPNCLRQLRELCDRHDVLMVLDEIATGFGRTGHLFATEAANVTPDIMCIGKALTGGCMTLGATITSERVALGVSRNDGVLMHGPTFMGNPLACAVACASIDLLLDSTWDWKAKVRAMEKQLFRELVPCRALAPEIVADVRVLGGIGVLQLHEPVADMAGLQRWLVDQGVWVRPFGRLLYLMPPFTVSPSELSSLTTALARCVVENDTRKFLVKG